MGEGFYFLDIVVFAMIAGFLVYRLRSVLGRRSGEERQRPNPFAVDQAGTALPDNVIPLPDRGRAVADSSLPQTDEPFSLAAGLAQVKAADPGFEEKHFLEGARGAFQMIVGAYAEGDTAALRPLLRDDVYDSFAAEIRRRGAAGEKHETGIQRIKEADVLEARVDGRTALVTVKIVSDQIIVIYGADGALLDGDPDRLLEIVDIWTFARNTRSRDPNWSLIETRTPN
ncbi:MAG: Tim44/TimA family putative adaptor protein [Rhodospirillaceae bacterium]